MLNFRRATLQFVNLFLLVFVLTPAAHADETVPVSVAISPDLKLLEKRLKKAHFNSAFIKELKKTYEPGDFQNVMELNVLLFLRKVDQHGVQVTDDAAEQVRGFLKENASVFRATQKKTGVSPAVIASLLYIESRYGKKPGRFQIASVFADMVQADRRDVIKHLKSNGALRFSDDPSREDLRKINKRTKAKVKWAMAELKALEKIYKEKGHIAFEIRGSFAGAFGMAQFLPSSYSRWAVSAKPGAPPDLMLNDDAIASVGNYLKLNGWKKREKTHMRALLNYNNSRDYASAILTLAAKAESDAAGSR